MTGDRQSGGDGDDGPRRADKPRAIQTGIKQIYIYNIYLYDYFFFLLSDNIILSFGIHTRRETATGMRTHRAGDIRIHIILFALLLLHFYSYRALYAVQYIYSIFFFQKCKTAEREYLPDSVQSMSLEPVRVGAKYFFVHHRRRPFVLSLCRDCSPSILIISYLFFTKYLCIFRVVTYIQSGRSAKQTFPVLPN